MSDLAVLDAGTNHLMLTWSEANEKGWITLTGIAPDKLDSLTTYEEEKLILFIGGMGDVAAWSRGDFALHVRNRIRSLSQKDNWPQQRYNEVWAQEVDRLARQFAVAPKTLLNNIATCSVWPADKRVAGQYVRYKHHEALPSTMSMDDKISMLKTAEENGWTWARLYALAHGRLNTDGSPVNNAPPPVNHVPEDVDQHLGNLRAQDVDELDTYADKQERIVTHAEREDDFEDFPFYEDEEELEEQQQIETHVVDNRTIRLSPVIQTLVAEQSKGVSITLVEASGVNMLTQDSQDDTTQLYVSFGDGVAYTIHPDWKTRTLTVCRVQE